MRKFIVVSGFLGSGKTTLMLALSREYDKRGQKACIISNDLGGRGLADYRYTAACTDGASELTGDCICYQTENLVERLRRLYTDSGAQLVMSDIPGFGVGALEHVYHKLSSDYPEECELGPFTVVTEADALSALLPGESSTLPPELDYILCTQLREADVLVLNKADRLEKGMKEKCLEYLRKEFPDTPVFVASALTGLGVGALAEHIAAHRASLKKPDIGYGGPEFCAAMGKMTEFYSQFYVQVCCRTFDPDAYLTELASTVAERLRDEGFQSPHLKIFAQGPDEGFCKVDLLGEDRVELTRGLGQECVDLPVVINASAVCPSRDLVRIIDGAVSDVSRHYDLAVTVFSRECFGAADPGRI